MFDTCFPNDPPQCHKTVGFAEMKLHKSDTVNQKGG